MMVLGVLLLLACMVDANGIQLHQAGLGLGLTFGTLDVEQFKTGIGEIKTGIEGLKSEYKTLSQANEALRKEFDEAKGHLDSLRKSNLRLVRNNSRRVGEVSDDCARHIGALTVLGADAHGRLNALENSLRGKLLDEARKSLGMETKAALSSADIPLPVEYSGEVVELVTMWGKARQQCTVFPLGTGTVKLPRLSSSPAFGFISQSASIGEKSPQVAWVTFTPSKLGGLVRLPSELDADSIVAIGQFVARYAARETARMEDLTVFIGDGTGTYDNKTGIAKYTNDQTKVVTLANTKTHTADLTLANARAMRALPNSSILGTGKYYFHPSFEQAFSAFNTGGDKPYIANGINGASLDGFPIVWVDALPAYNAAATVSVVFGLFGDLRFAYLGIRGGYRFDTSSDVFFATDEVAIRALERFDIQHMATDYAAGVKTAAA